MAQGIETLWFVAALAPLTCLGIEDQNVGRHVAYDVIVVPRHDDGHKPLAVAGAAEDASADKQSNNQLHEVPFGYDLAMKANPQFDEFNTAMDTILRADPAKVKAEMEADKLQREEQRKAKKQPSASDHASTEKD